MAEDSLTPKPGREPPSNFIPSRKTAPITGSRKTRE